MDENKTGAVETTETEEKLYTLEEVEAMKQSYADQRVAQALKTANRKSDARVREAEKLAQMNEQEKYEYQLKQREDAIAAKERELALLENKNEASKILAEKGIDLALVDFIVAEDAETMKINIDVLSRAIDLTVKRLVQERLASPTPKKNLPRDTTVDRKDFLSMGVAELAELKANNPQLYETLRKS